VKGFIEVRDWYTRDTVVIAVASLHLFAPHRDGGTRILIKGAPTITEHRASDYFEDVKRLVERAVS
jgi:hypothetical protein